MSVGAANVTGTAWITATVDGIEKEIARWTEIKTAYQPHTSTPDFLAPAGKDVTLKVFIESSSNTYKARMRVFSYTYSYKAVQEPEPEPVETPAYVMILCPSETDAKNLSEDLKAHIGDREIEVFTKT